MVHCLLWDIINDIMWLSLKGNRHENVIQTRILEGRATQTASFDFFVFQNILFFSTHICSLPFSSSSMFVVHLSVFIGEPISISHF